jgi:anionic glutamate receptor
MNYRQLEKRILDRILMPAIYDSQIRPKGVTTNVTETDGPTKVTVNLFVRSFEKIDDVKMEFSVQITFRQLWNDNRLAFNNMGGKIKYLTMTERDKVWMPDTFFRNEKDAKFHEIIQPNLYVRVFPNGDILYSIRVGNCQAQCTPRHTTINMKQQAGLSRATLEISFEFSINFPLKLISHIV